MRLLAGSAEAEKMYRNVMARRVMIYQIQCDRRKNIGKKRRHEKASQKCGRREQVPRKS